MPAIERAYYELGKFAMAQKIQACYILTIQVV